MNSKKTFTFSMLLAMQCAAYAQNPIVQTQLTTDPAPLVVGDQLYVYTGHDEDKAYVKCTYKGISKNYTIHIK